jgi:hypothetical protein
MRANQSQKRSPGWFIRNNHQFLALSQVSYALSVTASEITDAVSRGEIQIERINGCKAVALDELFRYIEKKAG